MSRFVVHRPILVLAVALVGFGAACGSSETASSDAVGALSTPPETVIAEEAATPPARVGSIGDAIEVAAAAPGQAQGAACVVDLQALQAASELYLALNGALPASQADLVEAKLIQEVSVRFEITAEGEIVPAPGSSCT